MNVKCLFPVCDEVKGVQPRSSNNLPKLQSSLETFPEQFVSVKF